MERFGLSEKTIKMVNDFFSSIPQVEKVIIFGSRARGNYKPGSDIDFALSGNFDDKLIRHISGALEELSTPYKFDVIDYSNIDNPDLKENIDKTGVVFYTKIP